MKIIKQNKTFNVYLGKSELNGIPYYGVSGGKKTFWFDKRKEADMSYRNALESAKLKYKVAKCNWRLRY